MAGLLFIYATFLAQRKQMAQQEDELEDQRKQFQAQQDSIKRQNFESSFFQFLNVHNQILSGLAYEAPIEGLTQQRDCFRRWVSKVQEEYIRRTSFQAENDLGHIKYAYPVVYQAIQASVGHYFRNLYHIIKFVDQSEMEDKRRYTSLVRAQLSAYELVLLFYNCLSSYGEGFKPLVEKYGLLKHLDETLLIDRSHRQQHFYEGSAFE